MKNKIPSVALFMIYALGIILGCLAQVLFENQEELYNYLENGVLEYSADISDCISALIKDNAKPFAVCVFGMIARLCTPAFFVVALIRGYEAGFAVITAIRLYGLNGLLLCGANVISLGIFIPLLSHCRKLSSKKLRRSCEEKYVRNLIVMIALTGAVFLADSLLRGGLSAFLTEFAANKLAGI